MSLKYRDLYREENKTVGRFNLVMDRIVPIPYEHNVKEPFGSFDATAAFISDVKHLYNIISSKSYEGYNIEQLKDMNAMYYDGLKPGAYEKSYANPEYAAQVLGEEYGPILSYVYVKMREMLPYAWMQRKLYITLYCELFIEIYHIFEDPELTSYQAVKNAIYCLKRITMIFLWKTA